MLTIFVKYTFTLGRLYDKNGVFSNHDGIGLWSNKYKLLD